MTNRVKDISIILVHPSENTKDPHHAAGFVSFKLKFGDGVNATQYGQYLTFSKHDDYRHPLREIVASMLSTIDGLHAGTIAFPPQDVDA